MLGLLDELQDFEVRVYPVADWSSSVNGEIESLGTVRQPEALHKLPKMTWTQAQAFGNTA